MDVLELAILGLLKEQELHGYELKKRLADTLGARGVSYGSLYPALGRLETAGAVAVVEDVVAGAAIPLTGSLGGELAAFRARHAATRGSRGKKVYRITDRGEQLFAELLTAESTSGEDERLFNLRLAFARYLPAGARIGMLERRRVYLVERLSRLSVRVRTGRDRLDSYARSLLEHDRETTEHDLSWIDRLLSAERAAERTTERPAERTAEPPIEDGPDALLASGAGAYPPEISSTDLAVTPPVAQSPAVPPAIHIDLSPTSVGAISATPHRPAAPTTVGNYRPSLSGLRPRTSEENTTV
jgi:DNA-binding PadR family transcriptional regulator